MMPHIPWHEWQTCMDLPQGFRLAIMGVHAVATVQHTSTPRSCCLHAASAVQAAAETAASVASS